MTTSVWETLSSIDCKEHVEKKGKFDYLAWTWAIAMVREHYPDMDYELLEDRVYADGSMEVRCTVTIEGRTAPMWLPVTDFNNKAIPQPNAFDINTARMRCLVKCIAVGFGLGHYIYAGESLPAPAPEVSEKYEELVSLVANKKAWELRKFSADNKPMMDQLFNMAPEGTKTSFKADVRRVYGISNEELKKNLSILEDAVGNPDTQWNVTEVMGELEELEHDFTWAGMNEVLRKQVEEKLEMGE